LLVRTIFPLDTRKSNLDRSMNMKRGQYLLQFNKSIQFLMMRSYRFTIKLFFFFVSL